MKTVLVLSGLDPSGAAGLAADIETLCTHHIHALPIATALTAQNTKTLLANQAVAVHLLKQQLICLLDDIAVDAIKIGLLASKQQIIFLIEFLKKHPNIAVILDPVIQSSSKYNLLQKQNLPFLRELLQYCKLITPNSKELESLTQIENEQMAVKALTTHWVLVTKTDSTESVIAHSLYHHGVLEAVYCYDKLANQYHGSGCTLSSAITANIVLGNSVPTACQYGLDWTYRTLKNAHKLGKMQLHPNRFCQN